MTKVLKRNGKRQNFLPGKVRKGVEGAAKDAELSPKRRKELLAEVAEPVIALMKKKRTIRAVDLRKSLLGRIDRRSKKAGNAWRRFDRKRH